MKRKTPCAGVSEEEATLLADISCRLADVTKEKDLAEANLLKLARHIRVLQVQLQRFQENYQGLYAHSQLSQSQSQSQDSSSICSQQGGWLTPETTDVTEVWALLNELEQDAKKKSGIAPTPSGGWAFETLSVFAAAVPSGGRAAVCVGATPLADATMMQIARHFGVHCATAFVLPPTDPRHHTAQVKVVDPTAGERGSFAGAPHVAVAAVLAARGELFGDTGCFACLSSGAWGPPRHALM